MKKLIRPLVILLLVSLVFTALTAFLPVFPFTLQTRNELQPLKIGFPFTFVRQTLSTEQIETLEQRDMMRTFTLPRYDLYKSSFSFGEALLSWLVNFAVFAAVWAICRFFPKQVRSAVPVLIIGALITVLFLFMPASPGTFRTIEDLDPMTFGFPVKYVEMTPDINSIILDEGLFTYLSQSYIAPQYGVYKTEIL